MYNEKIEKLIQLALADGILNEKEKQILFKNAETEGIDLDEFEMVLEAKLFEIQQNKTSDIKNEASPKSDKFGDIRKCPSCGSLLQTFQTKCPDCDFEFRNINSVGSSQKLFDLLQAATLRNSKAIQEHEIHKHSRLEKLTLQHAEKTNAINNLLNGKNIREKQQKEIESLKTELTLERKKLEASLEKERLDIIKNFPVPNSREDLLEILTQAASNAYDNDGEIGAEEEAWIQKTDQIYSKIKSLSTSDKELLDLASNIVISLIKKLPSEYKNFTILPDQYKIRITNEIREEQKLKQNLIFQEVKPYTIALSTSLILSVVTIKFFNVSENTFLLILNLISFFVMAYSGYKLSKSLFPDLYKNLN